ncbi:MULTISPECIES: FlgO family outer membrane protein [Halomonadaceae]|uniref:FlgO family outer membrane protein n=1 Tax=Halomonadaceae TaxID=28256 RepID=UPI001598236A|nr:MULTISPECIES: FlgO family outer membrane protein [Halomonas]QJQ95856.1 hypothetical protein HIO72_11635 [Halomonas sp. PA5]
MSINVVHMRAILRLLLLFTVFIVALLLAGCASNAQSRAPVKEETDLAVLVEEAAQRMFVASPELARYNPMIAATFVSIDNLNQSSTLGRMASELFASALSRQGMQVVEVKMRNSLYLEESIGELILSREVQRLSMTHNARSILMGTYAQGETHVYISVRVVRTGDAMVLGTANIKLPLNNNIRALLREW